MCTVIRCMESGVLGTACFLMFFNDSQMYISAVNFPLVFMFSVRRQMLPVSARRVAFVFRDFPIGFI